MKAVWFSSLLAISVVGMAGCGKAPADAVPETPNDAAAVAETATVAAPAVAAIGKAGSAQEGPYGLVVTPGEVFRCAGRDRVASKLQWSIDDGAVGAMVEVYVFGPGESEGKLFAKGGHEGEAETGNWVFEGTRFAVKDPVANKELISYTVAGIPCE